MSSDTDAREIGRDEHAKAPMKCLKPSIEAAGTKMGHGGRWGRLWPRFNLVLSPNILVGVLTTLKGHHTMVSEIGNITNMGVPQCNSAYRVELSRNPPSDSVHEVGISGGTGR